MTANEEQPVIAVLGGKMGRVGIALAHDLTLASPHEPSDMRTGAIFFIGTATVLIRYAGFTVLTDPNFIHRREHVDLGYRLSATRQTDPALDIHELPPLDVILLSPRQWPCRG